MLNGLNIRITSFIASITLSTHGSSYTPNVRLLTAIKPEKNKTTIHVSEEKSEAKNNRYEHVSVGYVFDWLGSLAGCPSQLNSTIREREKQRSERERENILPDRQITTPAWICPIASAVTHYPP